MQHRSLLVAHIRLHVLLDKMTQNLIRTNDPAPIPHPTAQFLAPWVHLWPQTQVYIFMTAVKWPAVVNLLMTSPFLCHQWVWVRATGTDRWRQSWGGAGSCFVLWMQTLEIWVCCHKTTVRQSLAFSVALPEVSNDMCDMAYSRGVKVSGGDFTDVKQTGHTSPLLSLSVCQAACCLLFCLF